MDREIADAYIVFCNIGKEAFSKRLKEYYEYSTPYKKIVLEQVMRRALKEKRLSVAILRTSITMKEIIDKYNIYDPVVEEDILDLDFSDKDFTWL